MKAKPDCGPVYMRGYPQLRALSESRLESD